LGVPLVRARSFSAFLRDAFFDVLWQEQAPEDHWSFSECCQCWSLRRDWPATSQPGVPPKWILCWRCD